MGSDKSAVDTVRISESEVDVLLAQLDNHAASNGGGVNKRREQRHAFRQRGTMVLRVIEAGNQDARYLVHPRNLSGTGIAFIHGTFLYPGTPCTVIVQSMNMATVELGGKVVRCRPVHGDIHEIGMEFDDPIEVARFLPFERQSA